MTDKQILDKVITNQVIATNLLKEATVLLEQLQAGGQSATPRKGKLKEERRKEIEAFAIMRIDKKMFKKRQKLDGK
jgi:hypothetical protein